MIKTITYCDICGEDAGEFNSQDGVDDIMPVTHDRDTYVKMEVKTISHGSYRPADLCKKHFKEMLSNLLATILK